MTGLRYVYAVCRPFGTPLQSQLTGVAGDPPRALTHHGLVAVVLTATFGGMNRRWPVPEESHAHEVVSIPRPIAVVVCYPANPTAYVADLDFYKDLVAFAKKHGILILSDLAYSEIYFDGNPPPSVLQVPGAIDITVEFSHAEGNIDVCLYRFSSVVACSTGTGNTENISHPVALSGTFSIQVYLAADSGSVPGNTYRLTSTQAGP